MRNKDYIEKNFISYNNSEIKKKYKGEINEITNSEIYNDNYNKLFYFCPNLFPKNIKIFIMINIPKYKI